LSPNEKVPIAVIGVGYLGQWHARKLAAMDTAELVAVVDTESFRCNGLAKELGCRSVGDYREIPRMARAAVVAVPTQGHFEVALHLIDSGMDLLVEKPLGADLDKAVELDKYAAEAGRILAVGLVERFNPGIVAGLKTIKDPIWMEARRLSPYKDRTKNVDVVRDLMIHDLDIAHAVAGSTGKVVHAVGTSAVTDLPDAVRAHIKFESGVDAFLEASRLHDIELRQVEVFQKSERILMDTRARAAFRYRPGPTGMEPRALPTDETDPLEEELRDFVRAVAERSGPRVTAGDGIEALKLATQILERIGFI